MEEFLIEIRDWAAGVVQSMESDKLPQGAVHSALNTQMVSVGLGQSSLGTRPGLRLACQFIPTSGTVPAQYKHLVPYNYPASNSVAHTPYLAAIADDGSLRYKEPDDSWDGSVLTPPATYPSPSTCVPPEYVNDIDSTVMNGRLFIIAGPIRRSLAGKTYQPFGLQAPTATASSTTVALIPSFLPNDTYSVYVTAYNTATDAESSPTYVGDVVTTSLNPTLMITLGGSAVGADTWRVYVQRQSTQTQAYLVTQVVDASNQLLTTTGNIPIASSTVYIDMSAAVLADLVIPVPSATENAQLSDEAIYITAFGRRMLAASRRKLFWSKQDRPEQFPTQNFEIVDTGAGDEITAIIPAGDELCLVLTKSATFGLFGLDPQYWTLKPIDLTVGCVGRKSVVRFDNKVAWWSPQYGPVIYDQGRIQKIGHELLGHEQLNGIGEFNSGQVTAGWDPYHEHIVWAFPDVGDTVNTRLLPWNYRLNRWVASKWDPFVVPVMATGLDNHGDARLFVMDNLAGLYYFDRASANDGVNSGTLSGTFDPGVFSQITTVTGSGFFTQAYGSNTATLAGHNILIYNDLGVVEGRVKIASNTSSSITLDRTVTVDLLTATTHYFVISSPYVEVCTGWFDADRPFNQKRWDRLFLDVKMGDSNAPVYVEAQLDGSLTTQRSVTMTINAGQSITPVDGFGSAVTVDVPWLLTQPFAKARKNLFLVGHQLRLLLRQFQATPMILSKLSLTGRVQHDRSYQ